MSSLLVNDKVLGVNGDWDADELLRYAQHLNWVVLEIVWVDNEHLIAIEPLQVLLDVKGIRAARDDLDRCIVHWAIVCGIAQEAEYRDDF